MRRRRFVRVTALAACAAVLVAGCGLTGDPVVRTEQEVLDAVLALQEGAQVRATAVLDLDEGEVRDVLRDDAEARELLRSALDGSTDTDVDDLLADLGEAEAALADHAVLLATGADGSARIAAEYRSVVWADLRVGTDLRAEPASDPADGFRLDLQLQVDWATAAEVLQQPDLLGELDEAVAEVAPFLGELPQLQPVQELLLALLGGQLVGIGGEVTPGLLDRAGLFGAGLTGAEDPDALFGAGALDLDPQEVLEAALTFDGFRRDGEATLVDVTVEVAAAADVVLDALAAAPDAAGMSFEQVEELRTEVAELPERLVDVATLRLDDSGTVQQARIDLLDVQLQTARALTPQDPDLASAERFAGQLERTGLFLQFDVTDVAAVPTVLGEPTTTVTPDELATAFGALLLGGLGAGLDGGTGAGLDPDVLEDLMGAADG